MMKLPKTDMHGFLAIYKRTLFALLLTALAQTSTAEPGLSNQLKDHPSPYLALHGSDPVAWQDWGAKVFERARSEKKLVYVSVGYFSCHWCHVMQKESYKDKAIAERLNMHFVPVKVDRELQPALDERLIDFAERTTGQAGWPLNVFLTPEGNPLYAVLYLPRDNFERVLGKLQELWDDPAERNKLTGMARREALESFAAGSAELDPEQVEGYLTGLVRAAEQQADQMNGGFGEQNKFPLSPQLMVLLHTLEKQPDEELRKFLRLTLDQMTHHGLYDHIGGGFFRYTVDPGWETPHFEKMLYDNAQLAQIYLKAAKVLSHDPYLRIARETLDFMVRDMLGERPAMVASFSAVDDKNVEGGYYLFSDAQLIALLSDDERKVIKRLWRMRDAAPFEAGYLPMRGDNNARIAQDLGSSRDKIDALSGSAKTKLERARAKRVLPTDTKMLAGWNGLALASLAQAARTLQAPAYRKAGQRIRDYLHSTLWKDQQLRRAVADGNAVGQVSLQDYAFVAHGLWNWLQFTGAPQDLEFLRAVIDQGWRRYYIRDGWRMTEASLLAGPQVMPILSDGPMPSPSALLAQTTLELARHFGSAEMEQRALRALNTGVLQITRNPFWHATQIGALADAAAR